MIRVYRGREPSSLQQVRKRELDKIRLLPGSTPGPDTKITGYDVVKTTLWKSQHQKCCYCELRVVAQHNDVEHFRPKGRAERAPGSGEDHGYFWLAFTWKNLLFACRVCNRVSKSDRFPLAHGSRALAAWEDPPGNETWLLIDPAEENGVPHIEFVPKLRRFSPMSPLEQTSKDILRWTAQPRDGSERGQYSIDVFGLNHQQYMDLYLSHVRDLVDRSVESVRKALDLRTGYRAKAAHVKREVEKARNDLFRRNAALVGLSYDALRYFVPDRLLAPFRAGWPAPHQVGDPPPSRRVRRS